MTIMHPVLLGEIDAFLAETGMGESYFGKAAVGNSEVVARLRRGRKVWPDTEARLRSFILMRREKMDGKRKVSANEDMKAPVNTFKGKAKNTLPASGFAAEDQEGAT